MYCAVLVILEGMAYKAGQLLAPVEGFGLCAKLFSLWPLAE